MLKDNGSILVLGMLLIAGFISWRVSIALYETEEALPLVVERLSVDTPSIAVDSSKAISSGALKEENGRHQDKTSVRDTSSDSPKAMLVEKASEVVVVETVKKEESVPSLTKESESITPVSNEEAQLEPNFSEESDQVFRFPLEGEVPEAFVTAGISTAQKDKAFIYFPAANANLSPSAQTALKDFANTIQEFETENRKVLLKSFLDIRETSKPQLAEQRAEAIQSELLKSLEGNVFFEIGIPEVESAKAQEGSWQERMRARRVELMLIKVNH